MNLFSLISGEKVHPSENEKLIKKKDFTQLKKASEILKEVKLQAKDYKKEVVRETELLKEQAAAEGFQEGLDRLNQHILKIEKEHKALQTELQKKLLPIALQAAKKILGEELKLHPDRIVEIVAQVLKPILHHRHVKIFVNHDDLEILEKNKPKLKNLFEGVETFSIEERDDILPGGCIIETEAGIINAQLENQWRSLETAFKSYMEKQKP